MDQHAVVFEAGNPTHDEGLVYARYVDQAAEGFFRFMLGRRAEEIIATAYVQPNHDMSYQHATFAKRENVAVGMVAGYTGRQHRGASRQPLKQAAGKGNLRMRAVQLLFAPMRRITDSVPDDDFYIQFIAVDQELRGAGVGSALLDYCEERGRQSGSTRLSLDVSASNEQARRFYERRGMRIESQWPKRIPLPGLKFFRMAKVL